jgi:hypothetical protein
MIQFVVPTKLHVRVCPFLLAISKSNNRYATRIVVSASLVGGLFDFFVRRSASYSMMMTMQQCSNESFEQIGSKDFFAIFRNINKPGD